MRWIQLAFVSLLLPATAAASSFTPGSDPQHINGGAEVEACGWPTAVAVSGGGALCTGTLIHPQVVVYAAHCGGGNKTIRFVEDLNGFGQSVDATCMSNPTYTNQSDDWSFCVLDMPVELPVTPAVYGCELEILTSGRAIAVVGFGNNSPKETGAGTKRWGETQIAFIDGQVMGIPGGTSVCSGDSGGPAFVQYPDGTWHAFAIASTVSGGCGGSGTYGLIHNAIPWIEEESGIDVTPCHDVNGDWAPTPYCQGFFAGNEVGYGAWSDWCDGTPVGESSETCGAAFDAVPDDEAPAVQITTPMDLDSFDVGEFPGTIAVNASDTGWGVRVVRIRINGAEQAIADELAPWQFDNVNFPQGMYELVAVAEDWAGNIGESEPVLIGIGEEPIPPEPMTSSSGSSTGDEPGTSSSSTTGDDDDDGSTGATGLDTPGETGCGCRSHGGGGAGVFAMVVLFAWRRRTR